MDNHRYLTGSGERCNVFLRILDLFDGKAETIEKALLQFCDVAGIEIPLESAQPSHDKHSLCCP